MVGVLEPGATVVATHLKRSVALRLVRRGWAEIVTDFVIRRLSARATYSEPRYQPSRYIPETMPPVDLPGIHFQEPTSDTWRIQHRSVNLAR